MLGTLYVKNGVFLYLQLVGMLALCSPTFAEEAKGASENPYNTLLCYSATLGYSNGFYLGGGTSYIFSLDSSASVNTATYGFFGVSVDYNFQSNLKLRIDPYFDLGLLSVGPTSVILMGVAMPILLGSDRISIGIGPELGYTFLFTKVSMKYNYFPDNLILNSVELSFVMNYWYERDFRGNLKLMPDI